MRCSSPYPTPRGRGPSRNFIASFMILIRCEMRIETNTWGLNFVFPWFFSWYLPGTSCQLKPCQMGKFTRTEVAASKPVWSLGVVRSLPWVCSRLDVYRAPCIGFGIIATARRFPSIFECFVQKHRRRKRGSQNQEKTNVSDVPRSLQSWVSTIQTVALTADVFNFLSNISASSQKWNR